MAKLRKVWGWLGVCVSALVLSACLGGGSGDAGTGGSSGTGTPSVTLALGSALPVTAANGVTAVSYGTPAYLMATVRNERGAPVANTVVSFATAGSMLVFEAATALTDSNGVASVRINAVDQSTVGATTVSASVSLPPAAGSTDSTASYVSAPLGVAVNSAGTSVPSVTLSLVAGLPATGTNGVSAVSWGSPVYAVVTLRAANGAPVANTVVSFAIAGSSAGSAGSGGSGATSAAMVVFNPASATALTDAYGVASIRIEAASRTLAGATSVTASASMATAAGGSTTQVSYTSAARGLAVNTLAPQTATGPAVTLALVTGLPESGTNQTAAVSYGSPVYAVATIRDELGAPVAGSVVSFASASTALLTFTPSSATALTDSSGKASVRLDAVSAASAGATTLTAATSLAGSSGSTTYTSPPLGVAVNAATVSLGTPTLGQSIISAYGSTVVTVPVRINGAATTAPIAVSFSSSCSSSGKASLSSPVLAINGVATTTYQDNNCGAAADTITAAVGAATASTTVSVALPAANNLQFVAASPTTIGIKGGGAALAQSAVVKFKVVDAAGNGKSGVSVSFGLLPANAAGGITLTPAAAVSDVNGEVATTISSGTVPTPVSVVASLTGVAGVVSQSNVLTIATGLPAQNGFSLSVQTSNIEGWSYDGVGTTLMVIASDRMGNPVPNGTAINFIAEGGQITPSCTTTAGTCSVTFKSAQYRPQGEITTAQPQGAVAAVDGSGSPITDSGGTPLFVQNGRVTVLAYTVGEISFIDANGNNIYDTGETFYDLGDPYVDANETGVWDSSPTQPNLREQYLNFAPASTPVACLTRNVNGGTAALPADYASALSRENTCGGIWGKAYVRRSRVIVLSGSSPKLSQTSFAMGSRCTRTFGFWLMDRNNNPMPAGTQVTVGTSSVTYTEPASTPAAATLTVSGTPVEDSSHAGGTRLGVTVDGGSACTGTGTYPAGTAELLVKTPQGVQSSVYVTVN